MTDKELKDFLEDIEQTCQNHYISIGHEDHHGAFLFKSYEQRFMDWLKGGRIDEDARF